MQPNALAFSSRRFRRALGAIVWAAAALFGAARADAGDAVRLLLELPSDVKQLTCGEVVDLQIVGEDAQRTRVAFGGRTVEVSATAGAVELVKGPYGYRYRTPAALADVTNVRIRAWLKEAPEVQGEVSVPVLPPAPFKRLVVHGAGSTPAGAALELTVRGEAQDGQMRDVPDGTMKVTVSGKATVTFLRPGRYRLETSSDATGTIRVTASLLRYPDVTGTLDVLVTGGATPPPPAPDDPPGNPPPPPPTNPPPGDGKPGGGKPGGGKPGKPGDDDPDDYVVWPGGKVRVEVWRVRATETDTWSKDRDRVKPGGEFVSVHPLQKIRFGVLLKNVKSVEIEEVTGSTEKKYVVVRLKDPKEGRFQVNDREDGTKAVHYVATVPEGKSVKATLLLTLTDGKVVQETFVLRRAEPDPPRK